ncbi:hypothetical protein [Legionella tunisiensis]
MAIDPKGDCEIMAGDDVLFVASPPAIQQLLIALGRYTHPNRRIMIAGGGHIGTKLAQALEKNTVSRSLIAISPMPVN